MALFALLAFAIPACTQAPDPLVNSSTSAIAAVATPVRRTSLDWEYGHLERAAWSAALLADVDAHYSSFSNATDAAVFCPRWNALTRDQRVIVIAEIIGWTAYYESAWDPRNYSVDVGNKADDRTWSVGLLQLSVVDQANDGIPLGYSFADLHDPIKNIHLGVAILARQIDRHWKILIPAGESGVYWSTLHPGGKYDKSRLIEAHVRARDH